VRIPVLKKLRQPTKIVSILNLPLKRRFQSEAHSETQSEVSMNSWESQEALEGEVFDRLEVRKSEQSQMNQSWQKGIVR
jgi:hypothetical protein